MPSHTRIPRAVATLLVASGIFVAAVAVGTVQQAMHRGIPTGSAAPAAWWPQGSRTCGNPGFYRTSATVWPIGDCAGSLIDPPAILTLRVGQTVEVHMTLDWPEGSEPPQPLDPLPTSTDPAVLRRASTAGEGSTATYEALQAGAVLLTSSGYCIHVPSMAQTQGPCPALAVTVTR